MYLKELCLWLLKVCLVLLCCLVIILAIEAGFDVWPSVQSIRISGFVLQILGMFIAFRSLSKIRKYFKQPTLGCMFSLWWRNKPKWRKTGTLNAPSVTVSIKINAGTLEVWSYDDPNKAIEKRIENILNNMEILKKRDKHKTKRIVKIEGKNKELEMSLDTKINNVKEGINLENEKFHTDGIMESLVGLVWITLGIILATIPTELYTFFFYN